MDMGKLKVAFLSVLLLLAACVHETPKDHAANSGTPRIRSLPSRSCMYVLWKKMLPLMAKKNSYIGIEDMEHVAGIRMQYLTEVSPTDTVGIYEQGASSSSNDPASPELSLRIETHEDSLPPRKGLYTWRALQWHPGSNSIVDLSCLGGGGSSLTLAEAEADLRALGLHSIGVTAGIRHMEVFANDWNEQAYLYYAVPVNVVPYVLSIHIVGEKAPKKHLSKYSHELIVHFRSQMDILLLNVMARSAK
jgi:hypothetical protein